MRNFVVAAALAVSLSACASAYVGKPYDRAAAGVSDIAMVDDSVPEKAIAYEVASVGSNFGLIGALVDAGIQAERQGAVNEALAKAEFDAEKVLEARMSQTLTAQGYSVAPMPDQVRAKRGFLAEYPTAPDGVDAYLDVNVAAFGYLSPGAGQPFRPYVEADVRLVKVSDKSELMKNRILYNPLNPQEGVITLTANPEYAFSNRSELLADPARLAKGIEDALYQVADTAAALMR